MRILICTNVYPPRFVGGAELVAHELALEMARLGHDVEAFVGDLNGPGEHHGLITENFEGIIVHRVATLGRDYDPLQQNMVHPRIDAYLVQILTTFRPDIVHSHNLMGFSVRAPILAQEHGARAVVTLHDYWGVCLRNTLIRDSGRTCRDNSRCRECLPLSKAANAINLPMRLRKDLLALAFDHVDAFIAPSVFLAEYYVRAGLPRHKLHIIPNGVDSARFVPRVAGWPSPDEGVEGVGVLYVGYLGAHKGIETLLSALALMRKRENVRLTMVGEGPREAEYRRQVADLGLENQVEFVGRVAPLHMPLRYQSAEIVVLPSVWNENQPVSLMEAMACGLPTVASRIGGIPEIVGHKSTGLLFEHGNAAELADALDELVSSPQLRAQLGQQGRRQAEVLTYKHQAQVVQGVFESVAGLNSAVAARPVSGLVGDFTQPLGPRDKAKLEEGEDRSIYIIPLTWLTAPQSEYLAALYFLKSNTALGRILAPLLSQVCSLLMAIMTTRQKVRLVAQLTSQRLAMKLGN